MLSVAKYRDSERYFERIACPFLSTIWSFVTDGRGLGPCQDRTNLYDHGIVVGFLSLEECRRFLSEIFGNTLPGPERCEVDAIRAAVDACKSAVAQSKCLVVLQS